MQRLLLHGRSLRLTGIPKASLKIRDYSNHISPKGEIYGC